MAARARIERAVMLQAEAHSSTNQLVSKETLRSHLSLRVSDTYNILYDDPVDPAPKSFQLDLCASIERDVAPNDFGIVQKIIPGGRCTVL
jgi:DNA gyrase inhibitor GyrI